MVEVSDLSQRYSAVKRDDNKGKRAPREDGACADRIPRSLNELSHSLPSPSQKI